MKFLCPSCKAKYQIADEKVAGRSVRMKCRKCGFMIQVSSAMAAAPSGGGSDPPEADAEGASAPPPAAEPAPAQKSATAAAPAPPPRVAPTVGKAPGAKSAPLP